MREFAPDPYIIFLSFQYVLHYLLTQDLIFASLFTHIMLFFYFLSFVVLHAHKGYYAFFILQFMSYRFNLYYVKA